MPMVSEMFPGRYLSYKSFQPGDAQVVTIRAVQLEQVRQRQGFQGVQGGYGQALAPSEPVEPDWLLFFEEYDRPMKLRPARANRIAATFGLENTDQWVGRVIEIYRGHCQVAGQNVEGLLISDRIPLQRQAIAAGDALYDPSKAKALIPAAAASRFLESVNRFGSTYDQFVQWVKDRSPYAFTAIIGVATDALPGSVIPAMKAYLDELVDQHGPVGPAPLPGGQTPAPQLAPAPATNQLASTRPQSPKPANPYSARDFVPIREDDIPF